jgi:hypothetical protein
MTLNHLGHSSVKDSTALWGWALNDSGYDPASIRGSFCDTENEYPEVYEQIDRLDEYGQKRGALSRTTVPEQFRSIPIIDKDGAPLNVCGIDDVVKWSQTLHGGKEIGFKFMYDEDDSHAPCKMGYCE